MLVPTFEKSIETIRARGVDIATVILSERGMVFREAQNTEEADEIVEYEVERFIAEQDVEAAAACLLQTNTFMDQARARSLSAVLCQFGDDYFYDDFNCEGALQTFQLASGLSPNHRDAIRGVIAVCLQGEERKAEIALPYSVVCADSGWGNEIGYITKLIEEDSSRYVEREQTDVRPSPIKGEPWFEMAGANIQGTGEAKVAIEPPLEIAWTAEPGWIDSGVLISGSIVIAGTKQGKLGAFELETGDSLWQYEMGGLITGTPAINGGRLFAGKPGNAICLDVTTGSVIWQSSAMRKEQGLPGMFAMNGSVFCGDGKVIYCDEGFVIHEAETGKVILQRDDVFEAEYNTRACSDGRYFYVPGSRRVIRLDLKSGQQKAGDFDGKIKSGPIIAGDKIVVGTNLNQVLALSVETMSQSWSFKIEDKVESSFGFVESRPAYANARLFFGGADGNIYALNSANGKKVWKTNLGGAIQGSPVISGEVLYILVPSGFCALAVSDGKLLWKHEARGVDVAGSPAIGAGLIVVGHEKLFAFRNAEAQSSRTTESTPPEANKPKWKFWK